MLVQTSVIQGRQVVTADEGVYRNAAVIENLQALTADEGALVDVGATSGARMVA